MLKFVYNINNCLVCKLVKIKCTYVLSVAAKKVDSIGARPSPWPSPTTSPTWTWFRSTPGQQGRPPTPRSSWPMRRGARFKSCLRCPFRKSWSRFDNNINNKGSGCDADFGHNRLCTTLNAQSAGNILSVFYPKKCTQYSTKLGTFVRKFVAKTFHDLGSHTAENTHLIWKGSWPHIWRVWIWPIK